MALVAKTLKVALLGNAAYAAPYDVAQGKSALVTAIYLRNTSGSNVAVTIAVRMAGAAFPALISPWLPSLAAGGLLRINDEITLAFPPGAANGDRLEIWAGTNNVIQLVVFGVERDV